MTLAALPMYDRPETAAANDRLWSSVRDHLRANPDHRWEVPDALTRDGDLWDIWEAPDLLLSQTCNLPYRSRLHGHVALVGCADNRLPGCPPGHYNSVFVIRADDNRSDPSEWPAMRFVCNETRSQSGWAAAANHIAALGLAFNNIQLSGAHRVSAQMVAEGTADIACIDAVTWRLIQRHDAFAPALKELERTEPTPGLPYITAGGRDPAPLRAALTQAIDTLTAADQAALSLYAFTTLPVERYLDVATPPFPGASAQKIA